MTDSKGFITRIGKKDSDAFLISLILSDDEFLVHVLFSGADNRRCILLAIFD